MEKHANGTTSRRSLSCLVQLYIINLHSPHTLRQFSAAAAAAATAAAAVTVTRR